MPKFGAHIAISELAAADAPHIFDGGANNATRLGAVGPDLTLFLFDPVTNPAVRKGFDVTMDVLSTIRRIKKEAKEIADIFNGPVADLQDWLTGGLSTDLTALLESAIDAMILAAKLGVAVGTSGLNLRNPLFRLVSSGQIDPKLFSDPKYWAEIINIDTVDNFGFPFRHFGHPLTDDGTWKQPEPTGVYTNWWWMDLLHYRKTGAFAENLIANARRSGNPMSLSYAQGYMSHVAGDICGHPFINALVEGPFRNHAYRHIVLEGLADTWLWKHLGRGDIASSQLHTLIGLDRSDLNRISKLIVESMRETYQPPMVPGLLPGGYPSWTEIRGAYERMYLYLDLSTSDTMARPSPPPDDPGDLFEEIQNLLSRNWPGRFPRRGGKRSLDYLKAILGYLMKGIVFLAMLATLPVAVLMRFLALGPRWLLYLIHLSIFMIISALRSLLALMGWGYASSDDFSTFGFLEDFITAGNLEVYPMQSTARPKPPFYWLVPPHSFPGAAAELMTTRVGLMRGQVKPSWIVDRANVMSIDDVNLLSWLASPQETRQAVHDIGMRGSTGFGNAVDLCIAMLDGRIGVPDLDLDGDRGYGYRTWEELPPNERYV